MARDKTKAEELTGKQKRFCEEYIFDFNASRAYKAAYPDAISDDGARASASQLLTNPNIQAYVKSLQDNLEETAGISRLMVLKEHQKLAFGSIAHLHNTWIDRKDFEKLSAEQKACIAEISTQIRKISVVREGEPEQDIEIEFVKLKLYDKQKSLDSICRMLGYDSAEKIDLGLPNIKSYKIVGAKARREGNRGE